MHSETENRLKKWNLETHTLYVHCTNVEKGSSVQKIYLEKPSKSSKQLTG
jgi:hypothetical protein